MVPLILWAVCPSVVVARVAKNSAANINLIFVIIFLPKRSILTVTSLEPALPKLLNVVLHFFSSQYELLCDTKTFERMLLAPERAVKRKMELCSLGSLQSVKSEARKVFAKLPAGADSMVSTKVEKVKQKKGATKISLCIPPAQLS